jgi:hypothetical protein
MNRKKRIAGIILVFGFLFLCESLSFGQCGGSARDKKKDKYKLDCITTAYLYEPLKIDTGPGDPAPDGASYLAIIKSGKDRDSKKEPLMFFKVTDKTLSSLEAFYSGKPLPANDKVTDAEKFNLLKNALRGQLQLAEKTLHRIK